MLILLCIALTGILIYEAHRCFAWKRILKNQKKAEAYHASKRVRN